jgi:hypothetical protein
VVTQATKKALKKRNLKLPLISSACPAVVRLIQVRFPSLIENIVKLESPMEVAAKIVRDRVIRLRGLTAMILECFLLLRVPLKQQVLRRRMKETVSVSGVISIKDIYLSVLNNLGRIKNPDERSGRLKVWMGQLGGEGLALGTTHF